MTAGGPVLTTGRLLLRRWRADDLEPFAAMNADPVVMEHFPSTLDRAQTAALIERFEARFEEHGYGLWAVEITAEGEAAPFIGFVGLNHTTFEASFTPAVEVGWRLAAVYWGHGYATEAAQEALRSGFEDHAMDEIVSFTTVTNRPSRAVMERLGMQRDPAEDFDHPQVPEWSPVRRHVLYRLRRADWSANRPD